jgi:very-short-patch-repair endonuclease
MWQTKKVATIAKRKITYVKNYLAKLRNCKLIDFELLFDINEYEGTRNKQYPLKCKTCGNIFTNDFTNTSLIICRVCHPTINNGGQSIEEAELVKYINSLKVNMKVQDRHQIYPQELDIYCDDEKIAIELDGIYWHSFVSGNKDPNYHVDKTLACKAKGIRLIHIFEDEWLFKQEIVKSRLKNILGLTENKIYARKCIIKEISSKESKEFLNNNHIQGNVNSKINIGLFYNNELVSLMCFNKPRLGIGVKYDGYELSRFCNKLDYIVIGGADKLLKYFIKNYQPKQIISYADRRWSQGKLYEKLCFDKIKVNKPNYSYIFNKERKHRFNFRKEVLKKQGFETKNKTEHGIMLDRKIYRIYDCGTITYKKTL